MANKERLLELADHIEKLEHMELPERPERSEWVNRVKHYFHTAPWDLPMIHKFSMVEWAMEIEDDEGGCCTVGCIAGHTVSLFPELTVQHPNVMDVSDAAAQILELDPMEANNLFLPAFTEKAEITVTMAADVLRRVAGGQSATSSWREVITKAMLENPGQPSIEGE